MAIADFTKVIQLDPQDVGAYNTRGIIYGTQEKLDLAFTDFTKAIQLNPQFADAYNDRGNAYGNLGNDSLAMADYSKTIQLDPQNANVYVNRGTSYIKQEKYDLAIADYSKALELNPKDLDVYTSRAWANLYLNNGGGAHRDASRYLELNGLKGEYAPYSIIVGYLGLRKSGKIVAADTFLNEWQKQVEATAWTTQIMRLLSGQLTAAQLLALAVDNDKLTEAHAYIGEMQLLASNRDAALLHFQWVKDNGNKDFNEFGLAIAELKRLK